jgi:hypothetical protein
MSEKIENTCTGCDHYEQYRKERIVRSVIAGAVTVAGMVGLALSIPFSGWVLFVGLVGLWAFI